MRFQNAFMRYTDLESGRVLIKHVMNMHCRLAFSDMGANVICSDYNLISVSEEFIGCEPYILVLEDCILVCDKSTNSVSFANSHSVHGEFLSRQASSNSPEGRRIGHRQCLADKLPCFLGELDCQSVTGFWFTSTLP